MTPNIPILLGCFLRGYMYLSEADGFPFPLPSPSGHKMRRLREDSVGKVVRMRNVETLTSRYAVGESALLGGSVDQPIPLGELRRYGLFSPGSCAVNETSLRLNPFSTSSSTSL